MSTRLQHVGLIVSDLERSRRFYEGVLGLRQIPRPDFGIAGGRDVGFIYAHGRVLKKVSSEILVDELFTEIDSWIAAGMKRPKRLKMAKPAALAMAEASLIPLDV